MAAVAWPGRQTRDSTKYITGKSQLHSRHRQLLPGLESNKP